MAERQRMTTEEVVERLLSEEPVDFVRESLRFVVEQLMEAEVTDLVGAAFTARDPKGNLWTSARTETRPRPTAARPLHLRPHDLGSTVRRSREPELRLLPRRGSRRREACPRGSRPKRSARRSESARSSKATVASTNSGIASFQSPKPFFSPSSR